MATAGDGSHRGAYGTDSGHSDLVVEYLQQHRGVKISKAAVARATGLTKDQVELALDTLSFVDSRLCEDDDGTLLYLP